MFGGARSLTDETGFQVICNILQEPDTQLSLLSYNSFSGFVFRAVLTGPRRYHATMNDGGTDMDKPIVDYVLKIALLYSSALELNPPFGKTVRKRTETADGFRQEAIWQQRAWMATSMRGETAVCPSIIDVSVLNVHVSKVLIRILQSKSPSVGLDPHYEEVLQYMHGWINRPNAKFNLGVITMPMVSNSKRFSVRPMPLWRLFVCG